MAQKDLTPAEREAELARREAVLAAREAQLAQEQAELADQRADFEQGKKSLLDNGDKNFVNPKEKLYDHLPHHRPSDGHHHRGAVCAHRPVSDPGRDPHQLLWPVRRLNLSGSPGNGGAFFDALPNASSLHPFTKVIAFHPQYNYNL